MRKLGGVPLVGWAIACAQAANSIDCVVVSSEDDTILEYARHHGAESIERPVEYATDEASSYMVVIHALEKYPYADQVCLLQPTSPFRQPSDIDGCWRTMRWMHAPASVSVEEGKLAPNGAVYWAWSPWLLERLAQGQALPWDGSEPFRYAMPSERSLDIDTENDWAKAERALSTEAA